MRLKYNHGGDTYEFAVAETKLTSPTGVVRHNNVNNYVPLVNPADKNASHLRIRHNGVTRAPIRYFDEPIDMLDGRTLADVQQIFQSGLGKYYFKAGDYFDITFAESVTLQSDGVIDADSTWRVVCLGIDHNAEIEGHNRGHFAIGRNTDNVEIAFVTQRMNATATNEGGWGACEMRTWLNSTFYDALSEDLRAVISPCTKYTDNFAYAAGSLKENVTATQDNIWLPAEYECRGSSYRANSHEKEFQKLYDYYQNGNSVTHFNFTNTTSAVQWWLRSPALTNYQFCLTNGNGTFNRNYASKWVGFVPCFTIGGDSD